METNDKKDRRDDIFSRSVRAGKRTYFFDVKATRADDYYLTITESTKRFNDDGTFYYEKHRLFLYKEDFQKYSECLAEVTKYIIDEKGPAPIRGEGGYKGNGASQQPQAVVETTEAAPAIAGVPDEVEIASEKSEEESDLVEDAHEKAMAENGTEEASTDSNTVEDTNSKTETSQDEDPESVNSVDAKSEIESKTE